MKLYCNEMSSKNKGHKIKNICVDKIINILKEELKDFTSFDKDDFEKLLSEIDDLDKVIGEDNYSSKIVETFLDHLLESLEEENESVFKLKDYLENKKYKFYPKLEEKIKEYALKKLKNNCGVGLKCIQLEFLLKFIDFKDVIVVLIIRLTFIDRRESQSAMYLNEFKIWKLSINSLIEKEGDVRQLLNDAKFETYLIGEITKSNVQHFMNDSFVKWLWESMFMEFNKTKYFEFSNLKCRANFYLTSYILLRILLLQEQHEVSIKYALTNDDEDKFKKELEPITKILSDEGIDLSI